MMDPLSDMGLRCGLTACKPRKKPAAMFRMCTLVSLALVLHRHASVGATPPTGDLCLRASKLLPTQSAPVR